MAEDEVVAEAARLRGLGHVVIPIRPASKIPVAGEGDILRWRREGCDEEIKSGYNIAMLHGRRGGTWAIDLDDPSILMDLMADPRKLEKLCVVRTPKQGHHIIFRVNPGDPPPGDAKYSDAGGRKIDIKAVGYTLLPPSIHPDKSLGKYQYLHARTIDVTMKWSDMRYVLQAKGFFSAADREEIREDAGGDIQKYSYDDLVKGGYRRGERRRKMRALYIRKRIMGSTEMDAKAAIRKINATCDPPIEKKELEYNLESSERWYESHSEEFAGGSGGTENGAKFDLHAAASIMMNENRYITHPSGEVYFFRDGIWIPGGLNVLLHATERRWRDDGIRMHQIREVADIVKTRSLMIPDGTDEDPFNRDATKIVLTNGAYDFERDMVVDHSPDHMSTIKHPFRFDPDKECPNFESALETWQDSKRYREMVYEMYAVAFLRKNVTQKGYVLYGRGNNGKSTCTEILRAMLGVQNTSSEEMQTFQDSPNIGHTLFGKCANIMSDGGTQPLIKTGLIKAVLSGDGIRAEQKYRDPFTYTPFATLIFTFNELPLVLDSSIGFARKIQLIPWENEFTKRDARIDSIKSDAGEMSGIFNRIIPIMRRLLYGGRLEYIDDVKTTMSLWMRKSDSFVLFAEDYLVLKEGWQCEVGKLYEAYRGACKEHGMTPIAKNNFSTRMQDLLGAKPRKTRVNESPCYVWEGVTTRDEYRPGGQAEL